MEKKILNFLSSGLLDKYVIGGTTDIESKQVEEYINKYSEIEEEYNLLQEQLELAAKSNAVKPPINILTAVLNELDDKPVIALHEPRKRSKSWYSVAASIVALVFAGSSYMLYNQNQELVDENNTIAEEIFDLRNDIN
jgi:hypothetical protein